MTDFRISLPTQQVAMEHLALLPAVARYCEELFPSDAMVTCNQTRVEAHIELGEGVGAIIIIDVDPVPGSPARTAVSGSFSAAGPKLEESDRPIIEGLAGQVIAGLSEVIRERVAEISAAEALRSAAAGDFGL